MAILECRGLCKSYGAEPALDRVDLAIEPGRIVGLLGPNGSGKSTLIKLANGLLTPDAGEILIDGMAPGKDTKKIVSYLPERTYFADWMTALQLLDFFGDFYDDFEKTLKKAKTEMDGVKIQLEEDKTDLVCPNCGKPMVVKFGRYGKFIACSGYPECKTVQKIVNDTGAKCPKCGGKIIEKKSKRGRVFYGCDNYPKCDFVSWDAPSDKTCPVCGKVLLKKKDKAQTLYCVTPGCTYTFNKDDAGEKDGE